MAYGYRDDGGAGLIVSLVQDYRNRTERKSIREQDLAYRKSRDAESDSRYREGVEYRDERDAVGDNYRDEQTQTAKDQFNITNKRAQTTFDQAQADLTAKKNAKQKHIDSLSETGFSDYAQQATAYANELNKTVYGNIGASKTATEYDLKPDATGNITVGVKTPEGVKDLTAQPNNPDSASMVIKKENVDVTAEHISATTEAFIKSGGDPKNSEAYIRASLYTDPETGDTVPATAEQMAANLKSQPFLDTGTSGDYKPNETSVKGVDLSLPEWDKDGKGTKQILKDTVSDVATGTAKDFGSTGLLTLAISEGTKLMDEYFSSEHWNGKGKGKGSDQFNVDPNKGVTVKPSKADLTKPENVTDIKKVKAKMEETGAKTVPTEKQVEIANLKFQDQMAALNEKYKGKKQRDAAIGDMLLADVIDIEQFNNYIETGDMNYSSQDMAELDITSKTAQLKYLTAKVDFKKGLAELDNLGSDKQEESFKLFRQHAPTFIERGLSAIGVQDSTRSKDLTNAAADFGIAFDLALEHSGMNPGFIEQYGTAAVISNASQVYYRMSKGDFKPASALPALAAINKGFTADNIDEFSEAYATLSRKAGGEDKAFQLLNSVEFKGKDTISFMYELSNRMK